MTLRLHVPARSNGKKNEFALFVFLMTNFVSPLAPNPKKMEHCLRPGIRLSSLKSIAKASHPLSRDFLLPPLPSILRHKPRQNPIYYLTRFCLGFQEQSSFKPPDESRGRLPDRHPCVLTDKTNATDLINRFLFS